MIIWDNTGAMHRMEKYPADSGRLLSRTTLVGEEPIAYFLARAIRPPPAHVRSCLRQ